jgi:hypothetical protein
MFITVCAILVFISSWWSKKNTLAIGIAIALGFALFAGALWALVVTLLFAISSTLLGRYIVTALHLKVDTSKWLASFLVGAGVYGTAVGLLAHFSVNYSGLYASALALPIILNWYVLVEESKSFWVWLTLKYSPESKVFCLDVVITTIALIYFVVALMPEVGHDALAMHLFIPAHLALRHQWGFDVSTYVWAVMPMLGDWLFSIGYMLAGETAARLINVGFIFILGWLVRDLVLWAGGSIIGARWAILIFISTPLSFTESSSLFIEPIWAAFVVSSILAMLKSCSIHGNPKYDLPLAGILLGCSAASKAVTLSLLPVFIMILIWQYKVWNRKIGFQSLLIGIGLFMAIGLIPYLTAWWLTDNPVFPFFNKLFRSPFFLHENFENASVFGKGVSWDILYHATFHSEKYLEAKAGASGFQWLLLFVPTTIALVVARHRKGIALLLVGALIIVFVFQSVSYFRFVFPAFAILTAAMGIALCTTFPAHTLIKKGWYVVAVLTVTLNLLFLNVGAQYGDFPLKSVGDASSRENYLLRRLPIRNAVELVNRINVERTPVAVFSHPLTAGLSADAIYPNWYNYEFQREVLSANTAQDFVDMLLRHRINFVILDSNWNGGKGKGNIIKEVTENISEFGSISVRRINSDYKYMTELLINPGFTSIEGWSFAPGVKNEANIGVNVSVTSFATQVTVVSPGRHYLNSVVARCAKENTFGRIQINWLDSKGEFINTDIKTFECSPEWTDHTMEVTAPVSAYNAVVYTAGHTSTPLEFKINSLRQ